PTTPAERWLLCSAGLNAAVDDYTIDMLLRADKPLEEIARDLIDETLQRGAPDNVTVVVFETAERQITAEMDPKTDELTESAREITAASNEESGSASRLRRDQDAR